MRTFHATDSPERVRTRNGGSFNSRLLAVLESSWVDLKNFRFRQPHCEANSDAPLSA
jgi:hypothetical protein